MLQRSGRGQRATLLFKLFFSLFFYFLFFVVIYIMSVICTYVFGYQLPLSNLLIYVPPIIGQCDFMFLTLNFYPQSYIFLLCHIVCIVNIYIYVCMVEINHYHYYTLIYIYSTSFQGHLNKRRISWPKFIWEIHGKSHLALTK